MVDNYSFPPGELSLVVGRLVVMLGTDLEHGTTLSPSGTQHRKDLGEASYLEPENWL